MKIIRPLICAFILLSCTLAAQAEVPKLINYQGKLTTAEGGCVDTAVQMVFSIYPDSTGIEPLWTETQSSVQVKEGIFNVLLGSVDSIPDSVFTGDIRYLGVTVEGDQEMTPRKAIVSVGYAYRTANADTAAFASNAHFADSATNADMVDGKHASEFLRFVYQNGDVINHSASLEWETVKACTLSAHTVTSHIVVHYNLFPNHESTAHYARITVNGLSVDEITAATPHGYKSRTVKIDVDNSSPLIITLDLKGIGSRETETFLILGN